MFDDGYLIVRRLLEPDECLDAGRRISDAIRPPRTRAENLWASNHSVRQIAGHPRVLGQLQALFGTEPIPFQTINFTKGTEQSPHADSVHFDTMPHGSMCGVWVALESIDTRQGPLSYFPGSHRTETLLPLPPELTGDDSYRRYEERILAHIDDHGFHEQHFLAEPGDVIIWHADLLHGGSAIDDPEATRHSQVTHYFFGSAPKISPLGSVPKDNRYVLRDPIRNIATGKRVHAHLPPGSHPVSGGLTYLPIGEEPASASRSAAARKLYRRMRFELSQARLRFAPER